MSHYDASYFTWQQTHGKVVGKGNLFLYKEYLSPEDQVLDFGCGGAYLLANLRCKEKLGIEINPEARKQASLNGIQTVEKITDVENNWADVIISSHALEHVPGPLDTLKELLPKLKKGGKIIFVVPYEKKFPFKPGDINQHLYTWSEMNLGNLFTAAGYEVIKVEEIYHRFPPMSNRIMDIFGSKNFHFLARIYGLFRRKMTQIRIIAQRAH